MELNQRCWNHEAREAACRCPACGRSYCRECVSEHEGRLLCAACLSLAAASGKLETGAFGRLAPAGMIAVGVLLAWLIYWAAGASLIGLIRRMEQEPVLSGAANPGCSRLSGGFSRSRASLSVGGGFSTLPSIDGAYHRPPAVSHSIWPGPEGAPNRPQVSNRVSNLPHMAASHA